MPSTTVRALAKILAASVLVAVPATGVSAAVGEAGTPVRLSPRTGLLDEALQLEVRGLRPRSPVTLGLRTRDANGLLWEARARARSDGGGAVRRDVSSLLPSLHPARPDLLPNTTLIGLPRGFDLRLDVIVEGRVVAGRDCAADAGRRPAGDP